MRGFAVLTVLPKEMMPVWPRLFVPPTVAVPSKRGPACRSEVVDVNGVGHIGVGDRDLYLVDRVLVRVRDARDVPTTFWKVSAAVMFGVREVQAPPLSWSPRVILLPVLEARMSNPIVFTPVRSMGEVMVRVRVLLRLVVWAATHLRA
jgi:hypothetical protein